MTDKTDRGPRTISQPLLSDEVLARLRTKLTDLEPEFAQKARRELAARAESYVMREENNGMRRYLVMDLDKAKQLDEKAGRKRKLRRLSGAVYDCVDAMYNLYMNLDLDAHNTALTDNGHDAVDRATAAVDQAIDKIADFSELPTDSQFKLAARYFKESIALYERFEAERKANRGRSNPRPRRNRPQRPTRAKAEA